MRTIKFRGKSIETEQWVYGYYVHLTDYLRNRDTHRIYLGLSDSCPSVKDKYDFFPDTEEVEEDTIGQFTGLYDKNGKDIYEGDIMAIKTPISGLFDCRQVRYNDIKGAWTLRTNHIWSFLYELNDEYIVIGNIHDNPELLKGGQE